MLYHSYFTFFFNSTYKSKIFNKYYRRVIGETSVDITRIRKDIFLRKWNKIKKELITGRIYITKNKKYSSLEWLDEQFHRNTELK